MNDDEFICGYSDQRGRCGAPATHFFNRFSPTSLGRRLLAIYRCDKHFEQSRRSFESSEWTTMSRDEAATLREVRRVHES